MAGLGIVTGVKATTAEGPGELDEPTEVSCSGLARAANYGQLTSERATL